MMRRFLILVLLSTIGHGLYAQESDKLQFIDRLNDKEINFLDNVFTGTANPAALSFNTVQTLTRATVNVHFKRGDFYPIDGSPRYNDFSADIFARTELNPECFCKIKDNNLSFELLIF